MENKETSDEMVNLKVRTFIALLISVITVTNSFSIVWQKIQRTEEQQKYNKERADRIAERQLEESKDYYHIEELKQELKQCKNDRER
jgi:predicted patatin/cPLA2 family phospholipase